MSRFDLGAATWEVGFCSWSRTSALGHGWEVGMGYLQGECLGRPGIMDPTYINNLAANCDWAASFFRLHCGKSPSMTTRPRNWGEVTAVGQGG